MIAAAGLAVACSATACREEVDGFELEGDATYLLPPTGRAIEFTVDSIVYDPAVGGTSRDSTRSLWRLRTLRAAEGEVLYEVDVLRDGERIGGFLWAWEARERRSVNTLDGVALVGLIAPFTPATTWDPLVYADPELEVSVAGEPLAAYKRWGGSIDSTSDYDLPHATPIRAVWVTLADDENLLELRQVHEVYGAGEGLLERRARILDTQNTNNAIAWSERAERGFEIHLKRSR